MFIFRPTFISIWKKGSVEQYSPVPYLATFINCMVWVLYGLPMVHPHSTLVVTINGTGFVIELVYLILFIVFSNRGNRLRVIMIALVEIIFVAIVALLTLTMVHTTDRRSMIVGTICILFNIMMYASPLSVMVSSFTCHSPSVFYFTKNHKAYHFNIHLWGGWLWKCCRKWWSEPRVWSTCHSSSPWLPSEMALLGLLMLSSALTSSSL